MNSSNVNDDWDGGLVPTGASSEPAVAEAVTSAKDPAEIDVLIGVSAGGGDEAHPANVRKNEQGAA